ncbi:hypothetical protein T440DRAFT_518969 [Plenodomus tracheiphilus IPT5]|uniref:Mid2 domain-containing protein n=1 Tax=Plenodomus tracheiphilus IPT5 TaxID=1408161 RepID=A0A6A7B2K2_9PLEO|nr:hypothetical protein T440DRAFT_518969 [Plenodomus tracheiphilus IPT5]
MFFGLLLLALAMVAMVSTAFGISTSVEPTIVHILVTSTVTIIPTATSCTPTPLRPRQWDTPSAPAWSDPAPPIRSPATTWSDPAPAWTQPAWTPSSAIPISSVSPTTAAPAPSHTLTYEETHRSNPKETTRNAIIAGVFFAGFFALALLGGLIACIVRRCSSWKKTEQRDGDVEMANGLRMGSGGMGGERSTVGSVEQYAPQRGHSVLGVGNGQHVHWPQGELRVSAQPGHIRWSRDGGYQPTG